MVNVVKARVFVGQGTLGEEPDFREKHPTVARLFDLAIKKKKPLEVPQISVYWASTHINSILEDDADIVIGYSVGEYTALTAAGVIPNSDIGREIIDPRQKIMDKVDAGETPATRITPLRGFDGSDEEFIKEVEKYCEDNPELEIGLYTSPRWLVGVGHTDTINGLKNVEGLPFRAQTTPSIIKPFHARKYYENLAHEEFEPRLKSEMQKWNSVPENTAIYSNVTGAPYSSLEEIADNLVKHLYSPVRFFQSIQRAYNSARDVGQQIEFTGIGPGAGFLKKAITETLGDSKGYNIVIIDTEEKALERRRFLDSIAS